MANYKITYTDDRHVKMREYARLFQKRKKLIKEIGDGKKPLRNVPISFIQSIQPTQMNFKGSDSDEPRCCSVFGCGRKLSDEENLYGTTCIHHQQKIKIDVAMRVSYPVRKVG